MFSSRIGGSLEPAIETGRNDGLSPFKNMDRAHAKRCDGLRASNRVGHDIRRCLCAFAEDGLHAVILRHVSGWGGRFLRGLGMNIHQTFRIDTAHTGRRFPS